MFCTFLAASCYLLKEPVCLFGVTLDFLELMSSSAPEKRDFQSVFMSSSAQGCTLVEKVLALGCDSFCWTHGVRLWASSILPSSPDVCHMSASVSTRFPECVYARSLYRLHSPRSRGSGGTQLHVLASRDREETSGSMVTWRELSEIRSKQRLEGFAVCGELVLFCAEL